MPADSAPSQTLSHSPSKWVEEVETIPSLLTQPAASAIICRGLLHASTPILQKRLWKVVESNVTLMLPTAAGCSILAALVRTGTVKTAAGVMRATLASDQFKAVSASNNSNTATVVSADAAVSASPKPGGKKSKAAAAKSPATAVSVAVEVDLEIVNTLAPILSAVAYRIDVQPERNDLLRPAVDVIVAGLQQHSARKENADSSLPIESGVVEAVLAFLAEKEGEIGNALAEKLVDGSSVSSWMNQLINLSVYSAKRDNNALKTIAKMIASANESATPARNQQERPADVQAKFADRAVKIASYFWATVKKAKTSEPASIRIPFLHAVIPHVKNNSVASDIAAFVTKDRQDIVSAALNSGATAKSDVAALLLNHAKDEQSKNLAAAIIKAVPCWTELISNAQLPQSTLSCFLALRQITQKNPSLIVSSEMVTVIDAATRHFLKQTLSAAEGAKMAVKLRLSSSTGNNNSGDKPQMLKVVDSDDEVEATATAGARRQRTASSDNKGSVAASPKPSPKNSANKKAAIKK